jgi:hypothetical protein
MQIEYFGKIAKAASIVYCIKGFPFNNFLFFAGIPLEPFLAGIITSVLLKSIKI